MERGVDRLRASSCRQAWAHSAPVLAAARRRVAAGQGATLRVGLDPEGGRRQALALRVARLAGVPMDELLAGRWLSPRVCPHCGHPPDDFTDEEIVVEERLARDPAPSGSSTGGRREVGRRGRAGGRPAGRRTPCDGGRERWLDERGLADASPAGQLDEEHPPAGQHFGSCRSPLRSHSFPAPQTHTRTVQVEAVTALATDLEARLIEAPISAGMTRAADSTRTRSA